MSSATKICVFTRTWLSSGAGLFAQELVAGLVEAGANVTFVAPSAEKPVYETPRPRLKRLRAPRERRDNAPKAVRALASLARVVVGTLQALRARLSNRLFIVTIPEPLPFAVPMLALLWLTGARIIFVAHDPLPHAWSLPRKLHGFERWLHGVCYRLARVVVVLSEPSRTRLLEAYPQVSCPVEVIEHGVFILEQVSAVPGSGQLLLFGTLRRNKGVREAIEGTILAARQGVPVRLLVAGEPYKEEPDYWRECLELAQSAPDVVTLSVGYVPDEEMETLFSQSDALILPYQEFFSQSGVAMMAASNGRPIIATRAGGVGALIAEGMPASAIAAPVDGASVAQAIAAFYATPREDWQQAVQAYQAYTREHRSWAAIGRHYLTLASSLTGRLEA
ncbi:glycosyltransferase family 4 protein [Novosphingobium rosa]|uniref:glycosyltransferase family 4 protein n=1 Tax=Novosphingobium rosa TaxID=76978 RepID=UPI0008301A34|nr:glycosyltransferase family 4 protein [Novosphingobium rosa]